MKTKVQGPAEDPETKAKRLADEARAERDSVAAMQGVLNKRTRRLTRVFGQRPNVLSPRMSLFAAAAAAGSGGSSGGGSGGSGVVAQTAFNPLGFQPRSSSDKAYLRQYGIVY